MRTFFRDSLDAHMPSGPILSPAQGGYMDKLLDGIAAGKQTTMEAIEALAHVRDPWKCPLELLPDLEREFGLSPNSALTESDRRATLAVVRYKRSGLATVHKLQAALDKTGFGSGGYGLIVTPNASPPTDPAAIVDNRYNLTAHDFPSTACAGNASAYAYRGNSFYYLVNGDTYQDRPIYPQAGQICARAFDGSDSKSGQECAGYYVSYALYSNEWPSPPAGYWGLVFFVGGIVSRNVDGSISAVSTVTVPFERRQELHRIILRIKPEGIWVAMIVQYN